MKRTVLGDFAHRLPIAYGGEVEHLRVKQVIKLFQEEVESLLAKERLQIMQAYEDGRKLGEACSADAYYILKYERR